tara:strand:+ start:148 stop:483 length:336 start_codon:yes stop_codon:yes gene_type:complete
MILSDKIWNLLEPATKLAEDLSREELEKNLYTGYYKLFTYKDSACVIAETKDSIRIGLGGGKINEIKKIVDKIEKFAKEKKINYIEILGRAGWEKSLNGYKRKAILLRKEV